MPCSAVIYFCIVFPSFNPQLLSPETVIADKIMKRIAIEGKMGHEMEGKDLAVKKLIPYLALKMKQIAQKPFSEPST